jgi:preprotein translocase subunit SecE
VADKEDVDSTDESSDPTADPTDSSSHGSHALEPAEPAVDGVPADADEPTFRDRERMEAESDDAEDESEPDQVASVESEEPDELDGDQLDGDKELVAVGAPNQERTAGAGNGVPARDGGRRKKEKATPRQKQVAEKDRRTGPVTFLRESVSELQKVVYPTGQQLINYFIVVLIFVLFIIAIVSLLDLAFGKAIIAIFS